MEDGGKQRHSRMGMTESNAADGNHDDIHNVSLLLHGISG